jgi:hypothetical protein
MREAARKKSALILTLVEDASYLANLAVRSSPDDSSNRCALLAE